jgi:hypothetical protein
MGAAVYKGRTFVGERENARAVSGFQKIKVRLKSNPPTKKINKEKN